MDFITSEDRGAVRIVTLSRPEAKNALNPQLGAELQETLRATAGDPAIRAMVLTGAGGTFCVGGDVKAFAAGANAALTEQDYADALRQRMELCQVIHDMPKPVIAAIEGAAAGAGLSIALSCDFRVCSATAKITTAFGKVGLSGDFGGSYFMTRLIGPALTRELYLMSPVISGRDADAMGLMTASVEEGTALEEGLAMASRLAAGPTRAFARMKATLNAAAAGASLSDIMDAEAANHAALNLTADHKEAARAFVEKRPPVFRGE